MSMIEELPERSRVVQTALAEAGLDSAVRVLPDSAKTAAAAAAALGCEVGAIANSLVFTATDVDGGSAPLLVMTSGRHRVDTAGLASRLGLKSIDRAKPDEVRAATGQAIGGVAPVGHPSSVRTIIDPALADYPEIWAAGGTPETVFPMTYQDLITITGGEVQPVADD